MEGKRDVHGSYRKLILGLYLLKILQQGPAYGNRLAAEIKRRTQEAYMPNTNALYPLLRVMEERGYVIGKWEKPDVRGKRIYSITEAGNARIPALEKLLVEKLQEIEGKLAIVRKDLLQCGQRVR